MKKLSLALWLALSLPVLADPMQTILLAEDRRQPGGVLPALARNADPTIRRRAVVALGRIQDPVSIPTLAQATGDPDASVREAACFALGQMGTPAAEPALVRVRDPKLRSVVVEALGKCAPAKDLLPALSDTDPHVRATAALGIGNAVYWAQREHHQKMTVPPDRLRVLAADPSPEVRWAALYALFRLQLPGPYVQHLEDRDETVRAYAARCLGAANMKGAWPHLVDALQHDPDWKVRVTAAEALGKLKVPRSGPALLEAARQPNPHVAIASLRAVGPFCGKPAWSWTDLPSVVRPEAIVALARLHVSVLADAVLSPDWRIRKAAATALGLSPDQALLTALVQDPNVQVRAEAVSSLEHADKAWAEPLLIKALDDKDDVVAASAADILGPRKDPDAMPLLTKWLERLQHSDRGESLVSFIQAFGPIGDKSMLKPFLTSEDPTVRRAAGTILKTRVSPGDPKAVPLALGQSLQGHPVAMVHTNRGDFRMQLFLADSPSTVLSFERLAHRGFYNSLTFHRVVPNFVVQGGDPRGDGSGGPGYLLRCEINQHHYGRGAVGMALAGKDTGGSQWFVTHSPQPHLDGRYTCFGQVESGMGVVDALQEGDRILSIEVSDASR